MKKKVISALLASTMIVSLVACGSTGGDSSDASSKGSGTTATSTAGGDDAATAESGSGSGDSAASADWIESSTLEDDAVPGENDDRAFEKFDHVVEVHYGYQIDPKDTTLPDGDSVDNNQYTRYLLDNYNIKVVCDWTAGNTADFQQKVSLAIASASLPDAVIAPTRNYLVQAARADLLADLWPEFNQYASKQVKEIIETTEGRAINNATVDGTFCALPNVSVDTDGVYLYFIRQDWLDKLGLEVPKTWDEFIDVLQKIKDAGEQPLLMTYKDAWTSLAPWNSMAADLAPENFADDRKAGKTTFVGTHEEIAEKYLTLLDYAQDDYMGLSYDDGNKKFANGDAVMIINGNWAISQYRNANPDVKVNMFALPSSNDESQNKVTSGVDVLLGVSKNSSNVDAAKDFVSFMMEKENIQTYIDEQFSFSALKGVEQSDEAVSGVQEDISNGKVANFEDHYYPSGLDMAALVAEFSLNRANGMDDKENIDQFLKKCDEKYDVANVD